MVTSEVVPARTIKTYSMTFLGGEVAVVAVVGDGDTDLDLEVYDAFGNLVASDHGPTDTAVVRFFPLFTQVYTVKVINHGYVHNRFSLGNN